MGSKYYYLLGWESLTQPLCLLPALLTPPSTLNLSHGLGLYIPSFSSLYNSAILAMCPLGPCSLLVFLTSCCSWSLGPYLLLPPFSLSFLLPSPQSGSVCWPGSVWALPDASGCFLPYIYNKPSQTCPGAIMSSIFHSLSFYKRLRKKGLDKLNEQLTITYIVS